MDPRRWEAIQAAFDQLVELDVVQRASRLAGIGVTDPELRRAVEALLHADADADERLAPIEAALLAPRAAGHLDTLTRVLADRYRIEHELGRGGMATVYLARDLKHDRRVAIKVLTPELAAVLGSERFLREIKLTAQLNHPHILPLLDSGEAAGFLFYVMPYAEGESLRDRLNREKQLSVEDALQIAREVADALGYAHRHDVAHRDIKPENILLESGHAVVADFGIARAIDAAAGDRLTEAGFAVGTLRYMSPEQATGSTDLDGRSDLYSLGCVLYEMLLGDPPFSDSNPQAVLVRKSVEPPRPLRPVRATIPEHVERAVLTLLARTPADRFRSAERFIAVLDGATPLQPPGPRVVARKGRMAVLAGAAAITVAIAAGVWVALRPRPPSGEPVSPHRVAILPFSVVGNEDLAYLHEGMVDLLSTALDGAGELRTVDPHALLSFIKRSRTASDPEGGTLVARQFGAGLYILGSVVGAGDRVEVSATLYDRQGSVVKRTQARFEDERQLMELVDELSRQILGAGVASPGTGLSQIGVLTTRSLPALREYLRGENALRLGQFDSAVVAYQRAVGTDTTFALAYYRLAEAGSYYTASPVDVADAIGRAVRHMDRLADHHRALLEAFEASLRGASSEAERRLRSILGSHPSDVEAWYSLGKVLLWNVPVLVRPMSEVRAVFERILALDPDHIRALYGLSWIAGIEGSRDQAVALLERWLKLTPSATLASARRAAVAYAQRDRAEEERVLAELRGAGDMVVLIAVEDVARAADDRRGAMEVANLLTEPSRSHDARALGHSLVAHLHLALGEWGAAKAQLDRAEALGGSSRWWALATRAALAVSPFLPVAQRELEELRRRVIGFEHPSAQSSVSRLYLAGLLSVRLKDRESAELYARELEAYAAAPQPDTSSGKWTTMARDLALSVRAHEEWVGGQPERALALLDQTKPETWYRGPGRDRTGLESRTHERYLEGQALRELGRQQEALVWFESFRWGVFDQIYVAPADHQRAELYERLGNHDAAARHYRRIIALWQDCDPELRPVVDQAKARLARLESASK